VVGTEIGPAGFHADSKAGLFGMSWFSAGPKSSFTAEAGGFHPIRGG
jgi:hypothetical protein